MSIIILFPRHIVDREPDIQSQKQQNEMGWSDQTLTSMKKMELTSSGVYSIVTNKVSWIRWNKKKAERSIFKLLCDDGESNMNFWSCYSKNKGLCNSYTQRLLEIDMKWPSKILSSSKYRQVEKRRITRCTEMRCSETWLMLPFAPVGSLEL